MYSISGLEESLLDRRGCGDELYMDASIKSLRLIGSLQGLDRGAEIEFDDEDFDEYANH